MSDPTLSFPDKISENRQQLRALALGKIKWSRFEDFWELAAAEQ